MIAYRLYRVKSTGPNIIEYESYDKYDFYHKILNMIDNNEVYYSPNAEYVTKETQYKLWNIDFCDHSYTQLDGFAHHYVRCEEISPYGKDRDSYIKGKLYEHYLEALEQGHEIFGIFVLGSQNYGLDIYSDEYWSDIDTKCIILPNLDDIILNKKPIS